MPRKGMRSVFFKPAGTSSSERPPPSPLRTFSETIVEENIQTAESLITKWDDSNADYRSRFPIPLFSGTREEAKST
ncbi:hypothetical protein Fmac_022118 [Flemingia macrophylla]|uniref:Uncharacterized protein n=1 Tax=Flemingia macrophylla TaxID=520843 RepID=A0ABD1LYT3_9FABA